MMNGISLSRLRNPEYAQFISDVLSLVERNDPKALQVETAFAQLKAENEKLIQLLKPDKGSNLTTQIEAADDLRDQLVTGINLLVSGMTQHFDESSRTHAENLKRNLDQFGGSSLARENYQSETAGINSMLADWEGKEELSAAITELNLEGWKVQLAEANSHFNELFLNRTEESSSSDPVSIRDLRKKIKPLYYRLRDVIGSYHVIHDGAAPYGSTVKQLNTLIDKYNQLLTARKGRHKEELSLN